MHECFCDYMCAHTCVNRQICLCDWPMDGVGEGPCTCAWMNMCLSRHMRGCVCMCVPMCVGSRTSHLPALWSPAGSSPAAAQAVPSTWTMTAAALLPAQRCSPTPTAAWGQAPSLAEENKAPFSAGPRGKAVRGWARGGGSTQGWQPSRTICHLWGASLSPLHPPSASGCITLATPGNWKLIFHDH